MSSELDNIRRACVEIITEENLSAKFETAKKEGRPLRVKMGFDPTAPDLHLGHLIGLQKLRDFQDLGHQILFLIGDFTAKIGDPSGRNKTRPPLSDEEVQKNAQTYREQVFKVLDARKTQVVFNSAWCESLKASDLIEMASQMNVARMLEREDFKLRYKEGVSISIHEFLYPLIQAYDSVALKADIEVGGQDQRFNLLVGRELQKHFGLEPQVVILLPLLEGLDGQKKMSKSFGNSIGIIESPDLVFSKIMSMPDSLLKNYYEFLTRMDPKDYQTEIKSDPREAKLKLAEILVTRFHSKETASKEREAYLKKASGEVSDLDAENMLLQGDESEALYRILVKQAKPRAFASLSESRRIFEQGGASLYGSDNQPVKLALETRLKDIADGSVIKLGKKKWFRVKKVGP
ncbi:MAG: tyrosine--tRNA ligase [Bradymonadales bacterium]|nr:MAG: tyrosine--tRNA ligase [Bradymonadales bacterium]